jgi:tRNA (guanine37-N1)-methyltransferase
MNLQSQHSGPKDIYFISIHPRFIEGYFGFGVFASAKGANPTINFHNIDLRQFATDQRGSVDERPYGGGEGMIMRPEPLRDALAAISFPRKVVLMTPAGKLWSHSDAVAFSQNSNETLVFICGRFGGVDQRFIDRYVDIEISIGDWIVSGGELAALLVVDSILRQIPGVLGDHQSATHDSFASGCQGMLEAPQYTKPQVFEGLEVPEVLRSGDHGKIAAWKRAESLKLTGIRRPELLKAR